MWTTRKETITRKVGGKLFSGEIKIIENLDNSVTITQKGADREKQLLLSYYDNFFNFDFTATRYESNGWPLTNRFYVPLGVPLNCLSKNMASILNNSEIDRIRNNIAEALLYVDPISQEEKIFPPRWSEFHMWPYQDHVIKTISYS